MSFDLKLTTTCDHLIFRELTVLAADRRTLSVNKPMASTASVKVYASDNLIPKNMYSIILSSPRVKVIQLRDKWPSPQDYFEICYITDSNNCPKCANLKVIDDISFDVRGQVASERDEALLIQNLEKWTVTQLRSNPFHAYVGTALITLIGQRIMDPDFFSARISQEVTAALQRFQDLQGQYRMSGRPITDGETLESIDDIQVSLDSNNQTILRVDVKVTSRSGKQLTYSQFLRLRTA